MRATAIGTALSVGRLGAILAPLYGGKLLSANLLERVIAYQLDFLHRHIPPAAPEGEPTR